MNNKIIDNIAKQNKKLSYRWQTARRICSNMQWGGWPLPMG